jgi:hypothetical protein
MLAAVIAGAVLAIVGNSVATGPLKSITVQLIQRCPQQHDCLQPRVVQSMKDETSKVWSLFDVTINWIDPADAGTSTVDVTVFLEEHGEPAPHPVSERGGVVLAELYLPDTPCGTGMARVWVTQARRYAASLSRVPPFPILPERNDMLLSRALGRALAHEIGHYLLGTSRHTRGGLMRAHFFPLELLEPATRWRYGLRKADRDALRSCRPVAPAIAGAERRFLFQYSRADVILAAR